MPAWLWVLIVIAVVAAAMALLGLVAWRLARGRVRRLAARIARLSWRNKAGFARALLADRRVPVWARAIIPLLLLYLLLPIDIIPDFIPVVGYLDDLAIVVIAGALLVRAIPADVLEDRLSLIEAQQAMDSLPPTTSGSP